MNIDEQRKHIYKGYTLVDITNTGVTKFSKEQELARNQQRNWETVLQILGMRTQLFRIEQINVSTQNLKKFDFGDAYTGNHKVWTFEFEVEFLDVIQVNDFAQVPATFDLTETAKPDMNLFYTGGPNKNIYITSV